MVSAFLPAPSNSMRALLLSLTLVSAACTGERAVEVVVSPAGNEMRFEQTSFTVAPGERVRLVMRNTATMPSMPHNVVVVRTRADVDPVGQAAMSASATDFVPASEAARIVAATPMAAPGETTEVEFTAPAAAGEYPYICTFPGHYLAMRGVMRVEA